MVFNSLSETSTFWFQFVFCIFYRFENPCEVKYSAGVQGA